MLNMKCLNFKLEKKNFDRKKIIFFELLIRTHLVTSWHCHVNLEVSKKISINIFFLENYFNIILKIFFFSLINWNWYEMMETGNCMGSFLFQFFFFFSKYLFPVFSCIYNIFDIYGRNHASNPHYKLYRDHYYFSSFIFNL